MFGSFSMFGPHNKEITRSVLSKWFIKSSLVVKSEVNIAFLFDLTQMWPILIKISIVYQKGVHTFLN